MFKLKLSEFKKILTSDGKGEANLNQFMRKKQNIIGVSVLAGLLIAALILHALAKSPVKTTHAIKQVAPIGGVIDSDFTQKNELSSLEIQQNEMHQLEDKLIQLKADALKRNDVQNKGREQLISKIDALMAKKKQQNALHSQKKPVDTNHVPRGQVNGPQDMQEGSQEYSGVSQRPQLQTIKFHYSSYHDQERRMDHYKPRIVGKTPRNYVPAGTFALGVLLEGADANASVNGQSNTTPILVRILDRGTLPNGRHSYLRGCFVLASMYGDISSERGEARLTKITCTRHNGTILEKKVEGYLSFHGKEGIRGQPVMRNGKILEMAGISGMLSGFGSAMQQGTQTQSVSPLGTTSTIKGGQVLESGLYGGASTAMGQLASYYIKRADQYHPIISIGSGTVATVIFQDGFSLKDDDNRSSSAEETTSQPHQSSTEEIKSLLKQAQKLSHHTPSNSPFSNVN